MKQINLTAVIFAALATAIFAGCASEEHKEAALAHVGDEAPPDFLVGPASLALNGIDGFSANVVETTSVSLLAPAYGGNRTVTGEIIGRTGRVIFQPMTTAVTKKGKIVKGGMFFIWDIGNQTGYVVSEALQGFAPVAATARITNSAPDNNGVVSDAVNGHPCHRVDITVDLNDGSIAKLAEWQADDLRRFPVRISVSAGGRQETVDFSNVRLDIPAAELFVPPTDFTAYANSVALINELMIRESSMRQALSGEAMGTANYNSAWQTSDVNTQR